MLFSGCDVLKKVRFNWIIAEVLLEGKVLQGYRRYIFSNRSHFVQETFGQRKYGSSSLTKK